MIPTNGILKISATALFAKQAISEVCGGIAKICGVSVL